MTTNRRNLMILFFTLVVIMLGFGMIIPIMPFYIKKFGASGQAYGALFATFSIMQFLFAPVWGGLSDRFGRKPILLVGVVGNMLSQILMGFAFNLEMMFLARILSGVLSSATMPTAMAFITDSTSHEERGAGMGMMGAAMGMGMVLGPGLGGWLAAFGTSVPFFSAAVLSVVAFVFILLVLPESLPVERRSGAGARLHGPQLGAMGQALMGPIGFLFVLGFLLSFGLTNFEGIFSLYSLERYHYGPKEVGSLMMFVGLISSIMQGLITGPATRRWGDITVIRVGMLGTALGFLLMLQATSLPTILLTVGFFIVSNALIGPAVTSLISKYSTEGHGMTMGLSNAFMSLGRIIGPLWAGTALDLNLSLPYMSGALIIFLGFMLSLFRLQKLPTPVAMPPELARRGP